MTRRNVRWGRPAQSAITVGAIAVLDLAMPINRWLRRLEFEQGSSSHAVAASRRDLWAFLTFLGHHLGALPSLVSLRALTHADLRAYLLDRRRRGLLPSSTARTLAVLRGFFLFLARENLVNNAVILKARNPKVPHSVPKAPSEAELTDPL
jgi:integrase/recombinase XerC